MGRGRTTRNVWRVVGCAALALGSLGLASLPALAAPSGSVSGRVLDTNGDPISGICVNLENGPGAQTDGSGQFSIQGVDTGSYKVSYVDCNPTQQYIGQWYLGRDDANSADQISVTDGADTPLQDVTLANGTAVGGTVTDTNGQPLANISVSVNAWNNGSPGTGTQTDANGQYTTAPLPPGDVPGPVLRERRGARMGRAVLEREGVVQQRRSARARVQRRRAARRHRRAADRGGEDRGDRDRGRGRRAARRHLRRREHAPGRRWLRRARRHDHRPRRHLHARSAFPPRTVRVHFRTCNGSGPYIDQWYNGTTDSNSSTPIVLAAGDDRSGVDAQLQTGIAVSGHVTDPNGDPIAHISVNVGPVGSGSGSGAQTDSNGDYTTGALAPGDYRVQFTDQSPSPTWATQYWHAQDLVGQRRHADARAERRSGARWRRRVDDEGRRRSRAP